MKAITKTICLLLSIVLLLSACAFGGQKEQAPLRVGMMSDINSIPYIVAKQQGFFDGNTEIIVFTSPTDRDSALFSGNLDGCSTDALAVCLAQNGELPMYITSVTSGDYGVLASKDSGIVSASDLEGREIGLSLNTIIEYVTDSILVKNGIDPASVTKTSVPKTPSRLELLEAGQIDAIAVPEPFVTAAAKGGAHIIGTAQDLGIFPCVMAFTKDAVENRKDSVQDFNKAYDKAIEYMKKTPAEEYLPAAIEELGLPAITAEIALPEYLTTVLPEREHVEQAAKWLFDKQLVEKVFSYEELIWEIK